MSTLKSIRSRQKYELMKWLEAKKEDVVGGKFTYQALALAASKHLGFKTTVNQIDHAIRDLGLNEKSEEIKEPQRLNELRSEFAALLKESIDAVIKDIKKVESDSREYRVKQDIINSKIDLRINQATEAAINTAQRVILEQLSGISFGKWQKTVATQLEELSGKLHRLEEQLGISDQRNG